MTYTQKDLENDIRRVYQHVPRLEPILFLTKRVIATQPSPHSTAYCAPTEMGFYPEFMVSLPPAQRLGIIVHECAHALLCHLSDPFRDDHPAFYQLRNIAQDYVVERFVVEACVESGGVIQSARPLEYLAQVASYGSLGWKEIYDLLKQDRQNRPRCLDVHTYGGLPPDQLEQAHKAAQELAQAAMQAMQAIKDRSQAGLTRPEGQLSTENGEAAPLDWRRQLQDYLQSFTVIGGQHWRSIELRSFLSFGTYSPKRTEEDNRLLKARLLLDTSGSMSADVANAMQDAARVLSQVGCNDAHLRFYGSGLLPDKVTLVEDSTVVKDLAVETSVPGGGGTSVISALGELAQEVDAIFFDGLTVAFTDGQDDLDVSSCTIKPDVWVIYGSESRVSRPSHGLAIYIEV